MLGYAVGSMFLAVTLGILAAGRSYANRPTRDQKRAARRLREWSRPSDPEPAADAGRGVGGPLRALGGWLTAGRNAPAARLVSRLALAGYRRPTDVLYFLGLQLVLVVALAVAAGAAGVVLKASWVKVLLFGTAGAAAGVLAPWLLLSARVTKRQRVLRAGLPDAIDIMVLAVEGGTSLNAAVNWVAQEIPGIHPVLGRELLVVEQEIQLGLTPGEAFASFADRCGLAEVRDLTAALVQSERYGAGVAKTLRAYADAARQDRQLWAEEVAQKAAVKILFPMLVCIFPAMFIVLLGPAALQMTRLFAR